ncbi:integrase catalytic domain-containing protein [Trichonephila inaurata madagascariensis]|uniref:Integrase catalytic domain-containing protein n=1 Tax=Trichonephila inaurata madagascariensis TaxID=2747483 RepID=A0A8X6X221_9ARAC|nr:integrase catalytic domain-containing protein [Trichonephila inaurata madagascariensis]
MQCHLLKQLSWTLYADHDSFVDFHPFKNVSKYLSASNSLSEIMVPLPADPADLATRGVSSSTLLTSIWLCGPKFLHETLPFQTDSSFPSLNDAVPEKRDCGSHYVGAKRKLMEFEKLAKSENYNQNVGKFLTANGIKWYQNVPVAPYMDGLREAGIKSTKYGLKRVVGETKLTYEEETFLTEIVACLN